MNRDLYIENKKIEKEFWELNAKYRRISNFLEKYEKYFTKPESKEALKKIKDYLDRLKIELKEKEELRERKFRELKNCCQHEIVVKSDYQYTCLICDDFFIDDVPEDVIYKVDLNRHRSCIQEIEKVFEEAVNNNEDIIEKMEELLYKLQCEHDIKIYRRCL